MRQWFMIGIIGGGIVAAALYFCWMVLRAFYSIYTNWKLGHEMTELEGLAATRRQQREQENRERLDNGCQHVFEMSPGASPRRVCRRCGREAEKPAEDCDHVWRRIKGAVPRSFCDTCGQTINGWIGIEEPVTQTET